MIETRKFSDIGRADHGWLKARHHFSFGGYYDANRMGWGPIRVWNDDEIAAQSGFAPHSHQDMEIITYVREGAITHQDSKGNKGRTVAGDVQVMSAGSGIEHSEYNHEHEDTKLFQIWIKPRKLGGDARWDAKKFPKTSSQSLSVLASGYQSDIDAGALMIGADARLYGSKLPARSHIKHKVADGSYVYLVVSKGALTVNGQALGERDAAAIKDEHELIIEANDGAEFLLLEAA